MSILNQNLLTLDFWQDKVTYGKQTVPIGTIGCAALNITDEQITELITLCQPLSSVILMIGTGNVDVSAVSYTHLLLSLFRKTADRIIL